MAKSKAERDDWLACDCAGCGREILGESMREKFPKLAGERFVAGRIFGRPYCSACLRVRKPPEKPATREEDGGPWQQNAVRDLEEDR